MKKKILCFILLFVIFTFILVFVINKDNIENSTYFAWMDAYIATEVKVENSIALTYYFEDEPFNIKDVVSISFSDLDETVTIINYFFSEQQKINESHLNRAITLTFIANDIGVYKTDGINILFKNGEVTHYPVGEWTFDINEPTEEIVNTWSGPVASSNRNEFTYEYSLYNPDAVIAEIYVGDDFYVNNYDESLLNGVIDIKNNYKAPIVYIKTKIKVILGDNIFINTGKGCYCGAYGFGEDVLKISEERNSVF